MSGTANTDTSIAGPVALMFLAASAAAVILPLFMFPHELNIILFFAYFPIAGMIAFFLYRGLKKRAKIRAGVN